MLINETTRCFPRTSRDAFDDGYQWIEHYKRPTNYFSVVGILLVVAIVVVLLVKEM
jgi:hypothetical protein